MSLHSVSNLGNGDGAVVSATSDIALIRIKILVQSVSEPLNGRRHIHNIVQDPKSSRNILHTTVNNVIQVCLVLMAMRRLSIFANEIVFQIAFAAREGFLQLRRICCWVLWTNPTSVQAVDGNIESTWLYV